MSTYGEYQEDTATALTALLSTSELPTDPESIRNTLECRSVLLDDARNRLLLFGAQRRGPGRDTGPVGMLASTLDRMPSSRELHAPGGLSPLDALTLEPTDPTARWWQEAASSHVLATHQLAAAVDRDAWLTDDGSLWHLVGDCASVVEALGVLDHDLADVGLLPTTLTPSELDQARADASYLAKTASWYTTNPGADFATAESHQQKDNAGVLLVSTPQDLAPAQRNLAAYIRPLSGHTTSPDALLPRITADEALGFIKSQETLASRLADVADRVPGATTAAAGFRTLAAQLNSLQPEVWLLSDVDPTPTRPHIIAQLTEMTSRARALDGGRKLVTLSPQELTDLLHASREACVQGARALRIEGSREHSNIRRTDLTKQVGPTRITHNNKLNARLNTLIATNAQPVGLPPWTPVQGLQRATLRQTLDSTPTSRPPQYPSPRGRDTYGR